MLRRLRRNRKSSALRALSSETVLTASDLVAPFFIVEGTGVRDPIVSMPGIERLSIDQLLIDAEELHSLGIQAIALFPKIESELKDLCGSLALHEDGLVPRAVKALKSALPNLCVIADVALDPYTSHGHDGLVENGAVVNDATVEVLAKQALVLSSAGVDIVAPSDMMDGRVKAIREMLDRHQFENVNICAYTAKYASAFYGPFRNALGSTKIGLDKRTYQMNPANIREAFMEAELDVNEGADMLMVKPALCYLDVIAALKKQFHLPICAYQVSGEYAMIMAAGKAGYLDVKPALFEALLSIKRAGASCIFTYAAKQMLKNGYLEESLDRLMTNREQHTPVGLS